MDRDNSDVDENGMATWQTFLQIHARIMCKLSHDLQAQQNLALIWYEVLYHLSHNPGLRLQDLAQAISLSQSGVTRLLDRMAEAGLIERKPCPHDRRGAIAVITPAGRAIYEQAEPVYQYTVKTLFLDPLNDEAVKTLQETFSVLLKKIEE